MDKGVVISHKINEDRQFVYLCELFKKKELFMYYKRQLKRPFGREIYV